jgi:hypothetical protein
MAERGGSVGAVARVVDAITLSHLDRILTKSKVFGLRQRQLRHISNAHCRNCRCRSASAMRRLNKAALDNVVFAPTGFFLTYQACHKGAAAVLLGGEQKG